LQVDINSFVLSINLSSQSRNNSCARLKLILFQRSFRAGKYLPCCFTLPSVTASQYSSYGALTCLYYFFPGGGAKTSYLADRQIYLITFEVIPSSSRMRICAFTAQLIALSETCVCGFITYSLDVQTCQTPEFSVLITFL
jgi:hypothetical protein